METTNSMNHYFFVLKNGEILPSAHTDAHFTLRDMREQYVGRWVRVGDGPDDFDRVADVQIVPGTVAASPRAVEKIA